jgi:hypothetical protein
MQIRPNTLHMRKDLQKLCDLQKLALVSRATASLVLRHSIWHLLWIHVGPEAMCSSVKTSLKSVSYDVSESCAVSIHKHTTRIIHKLRLAHWSAPGPVFHTRICLSQVPNPMYTDNYLVIQLKPAILRPCPGGPGPLSLLGNNLSCSAFTATTAIILPLVTGHRSLSL